jgi:hypothetical protein
MARCRRRNPSRPTREVSKRIVELKLEGTWKHVGPIPSGSLADQITAVSDPTLIGRRVLGMQEPGEVYEFMFWHLGRQVYAKICLQPSLVVIVYSAHRPLRGDRL